MPPIDGRKILKEETTMAMNAKNLPREFVLLVERVLIEYPALERELSALEEAIAAACHAPLYSGDGVRGSGGGASEPERVFEAKGRNPHYRWLEDCVAMIRDGYAALAAQEKEVVEMLCWQGLKGWEIADMLKIEERSVWRIKTRAFCKLARLFLPHLVRGCEAAE